MKDDLVIVDQFNDLPEAQIAQAFLLSHDIESLIPNEYSSTMMSHVIIAMGHVKLMVRDADLERSRELLKQYREKPMASETTDAQDELKNLNSDPEPNLRDLVSKRACTNAVLGTMAVPVFLNLYSIYLIFKFFFRTKGTITSKAFWNIAIAILFNSIAILLWYFFGPQIFKTHFG
jgi:hypothetical protein